MKKSAFLVLTTLLAAASARAQTIGAVASPATRATQVPDRAAEQQAANQTQRLADEVGLTAAQQPRVRQIFLTTRRDMDAARTQATASGNSQGLRAAMQTARAKADTELRAVLTPAQFAKYQQIMAARISQLHTTVQTN